MPLTVLRLLSLAAVLVVVAAASAASEAALARVGPARAGELLAHGRRGARALARVAADPAPTLSVATLVRVSAESCAAVTVAFGVVGVVGLGWPAALASAALLTGISYVAVGVGPRTFGRQYSEPVALVAAPLFAALARVLGPLTRLLVLLGNALTPGQGYRYGPFASEAELRELVDLAQETEVIEAGERRMIHSVIDLGDTVAREVMVPRPDMVWIECGKTLPQAMSLFLRSGYSRVPVVDEGPDDVRGVLYLKDVARRLHEHPETAAGQPVESVMREVVFVPDSKPAYGLLREMQRAGHAAIVVDEYGGTAGLVTIEDILEEIVGDISDEYDREKPEVEDLGHGLYRVSARLHIDDLGELFGVVIDEEEVDTVGGLLAKAIGRVPIAGSQAQVAGLLITADRLEGRRHRLASLLVSREINIGTEEER